MRPVLVLFEGKFQASRSGSACERFISALSTRNTLLSLSFLKADRVIGVEAGPRTLISKKADQSGHISDKAVGLGLVIVPEYIDSSASDMGIHWVTIW
jgi:hypothetical protein